MRSSDADGFDTVVSLETIEHVPDPAGFVSRLVALLRPGGVFIGSVPTTPSGRCESEPLARLHREFVPIHAQAARPDGGRKLPPDATVRRDSVAAADRGTHRRPALGTRVVLPGPILRHSSAGSARRSPTALPTATSRCSVMSRLNWTLPSCNPKLSARCSPRPSSSCRPKTKAA